MVVPKRGKLSSRRCFYMGVRHPRRNPVHTGSFLAPKSKLRGLYIESVAERKKIVSFRVGA